jgi:hypothetical protein
LRAAGSIRILLYPAVRIPPSRILPMNAPPLRPRSVGEILDLAFQLYRSRWKEMAVATGVLVTPLLLLEAIAPYSLLALLEVASNLFFLIAGAAVVSITAGAYRGQDVDAIDAIDHVRRRIVPVLCAAFLQGLVVWVGFLALVIPGFIALAATFAMQQAVMVEGVGATDAFERSRALASGSYWTIVRTSVMAYLIAFAAMLGASMQMDEVVSNVRLAILLRNVVLIGLNPLAAVIGTVLYFDLRVRKEAYDVEMMTERLGPAVPSLGAPLP